VIDDGVALVGSLDKRIYAVEIPGQ
jgi:hypothetical protein